MREHSTKIRAERHPSDLLTRKSPVTRPQWCQGWGKQKQAAVSVKPQQVTLKNQLINCRGLKSEGKGEREKSEDMVQEAWLGRRNKEMVNGWRGYASVVLRTAPKEGSS